MNVNGLVKGILLVGAGMVLQRNWVSNDVEKGEIVHEDENIYVKAEKDKRYGYSRARVHYKKPIVEEEK